jgi:hypothetical protein
MSPSISPLTAPAPKGAFVRERPEAPRPVDACIYLGGMGPACQEGYDAEQDPIVRRYIMRLVEAEARRTREDMRKNGGKLDGVPHAEQAIFCKETGPCGGTDGDGNPMDSGYACLTRASGSLDSDKAASRRAHERACRCDPDHAEIPIMGGFGLLACDGKKTVELGRTMSLDEATDARACASCDPDAGPEACKREIAKLAKADKELSRYVETVHVPVCQTP